MPKRYFTAGEFLEVERVSGTTVAETILTRPSTCHGCVIACGRVVRFGEGPEQKGPEYETTVGFGPLLGVSDLAFITRMGGLCDRYGMDSISTSNVIGLAFLLFERGPAVAPRHRWTGAELGKRGGHRSPGAPDRAPPGPGRAAGAWCTRPG